MAVRPSGQVGRSSNPATMTHAWEVLAKMTCFAISIFKLQLFLAWYSIISIISDDSMTIWDVNYLNLVDQSAPGIGQKSFKILKIPFGVASLILNVVVVSVVSVVVVVVDVFVERLKSWKTSAQKKGTMRTWSGRLVLVIVKVFGRLRLHRVIIT